LKVALNIINKQTICLSISNNDEPVLGFTDN